MNRVASLVSLTAVALAAGCASGDHSPVATAGQGQLVLVCKLKPDVDPLSVVPAANALSKLPGTIDVTAAVNTASRTEVVFVATFGTPAAGAAAIGSVNPTFAAGGYADKIESTDVHGGTLQNYLVSEQYTQETTTADIQRRSAVVKQQRELFDRTK